MITKKSAGYYPRIHLEGSYVDHSDTSIFSQKYLQGAIHAEWSLWNSGATVAQARQARYQYQQAYQRWRRVGREVEADVYRLYLGLRLGYQQLRADQQAVLSQQIALKSSEVGYRAGTRNMVDVLRAQSVFYKAKQRFIEDRYHYLVSVLKLKRATGQLNDKSLLAIERLLSKSNPLRPRDVCHVGWG